MKFITNHFNTLRVFLKIDACIPQQKSEKLVRFSGKTEFLFYAFDAIIWKRWIQKFLSPARQRPVGLQPSQAANHRPIGKRLEGIDVSRGG